MDVLGLYLQSLLNAFIEEQAPHGRDCNVTIRKRANLVI